MRKQRTTTTIYTRDKIWILDHYENISAFIHEMVKEKRGEPKTKEGIKDRIKEIEDKEEALKKEKEHYKKRLERIKKREEEKKKRMENLEKAIERYEEELRDANRRIEEEGYPKENVLSWFRGVTGYECTIEEFDIIREKVKEKEEVEEEEPEGEEGNWIDSS